MTRRRARAVTASLAVMYGSLAVAGALGMSWPSGPDLFGWAVGATRVSGALAMTASLVALWAQLRRRWLVELQAVPVIGLGLTCYVAVLLLYVGPERPCLLMSAIIVGQLAALSLRATDLSEKVSRRTSTKRRAAAAGYG